MNRSPSRPLNVLVMHSDPLLCGGLAAALRQHASFETFVYGVDNLSANEARIDRSKHDNALSRRTFRGVGELRTLQQ
jgi:hypothetical protein